MTPIPADVRQILAELEMLSHGSTQAWNKTAPASERDLRPAGEAHPPHLEYRRQYEQATSDLERDRVRQAAKRTLREWKGEQRAHAQQEPEHLRRQEIIRRGEGWDASEVARVYKTSVREIINIREAAGRDPSTGKIPPAEEDATDQARRLFESGMTVRQIAGYQKVEPSTVSRRIRKAA